MQHDGSEPERWSRLFAWMYGLTGRNSLSNRLVVEQAALDPGDKVLDLGCGPGAALAAASRVVDPSQLAGVDPTPGFIDQCRRRFPTADIRLGEAEDIPFEDDRFTMAWTISSLHHWVDADAGLVELLRVLCPAGRVIVAEDLVRRPGGHGVARGRDRRSSRQGRGCRIRRGPGRYRPQTVGQVDRGERTETGQSGRLSLDQSSAADTSFTIRSTDGMAMSSSDSAAGSGMCGVVIRTTGPSRSQKASLATSEAISAPHPHN